MTRLVILTYGNGRIFMRYINTYTDEQAVLDVSEIVSRETGLAPEQYLVLSGSAAHHIGPGAVRDLIKRSV